MAVLKGEEEEGRGGEGMAERRNVGRESKDKDTGDKLIQRHTKTREREGEREMPEHLQCLVFA